MKKSLCLLTALIVLLSLAACGPVSEGPTTPPTGDPTAPPSSDSTMAANTCPCSVMVDGELFFTYFEKADIDPETVQPAGTITRASCDISATPKENDTSNFETCVGQPYSWVDGDLILFYDNQWNICYRTDEVGGSYKIMVDGILYYTFSKPAPTPADDEIAGNIETCTEGLWVYPTENDQTNHEPFVGQPYAFVDGNLVLYYNDQWNTCRPFSELEPSETQPTEAPTTEPTTAPTEPPEPETPWVLADREAPSYDDFFSQDRSYGTCASYEWLADSGTVYSLRHDMSGLYITKNFWDAEYRVPNTEDLYNLPIIGADGKWGYLLSPDGILRLGLLTGETSLIVENGHILQAELRGYDLLYYAAENDGGAIGIHRLYLPAMILDTVYDGITLDHQLGSFAFSAPDTTLGTVTWSSLNPEMVNRVTVELDNPDSPYKSDGAENSIRTDHLWDDRTWLQEPGAYRNHALWLCYWLQQDTGIHTWYKCSYDSITGTLTEDTGVIDNCWFGSGYAHDHYEPEITELPDPVPAPSEWIQIPDAALPAAPTADELYAEGVYDHYSAGVPGLTIHGNPLEPPYLYTRSEYTLTKLLDTPVIMVANSVYYIYCVTEDHTVLQLDRSGTIVNTLYTAREEIRAIDQANGHLYILDGDTLIELDIPAMQYRVLLEQTDIIEMQAWDEPGQIYFCVARGLHYQQYLYHTDTDELERTHFL